MAGRWGLGPVFAFESLISARRWQVYALRASFVALLLAGLGIVWLNVCYSARPGRPVAAGGPTFQQLAELGANFFYALAGVQLSLVMLAAPAFAAGSICMDRARGTLLHLMVTDLSDAEIVLGKLGSRLAPVFGLICCAVPVAALAALLGGIDFAALAGLFAVSVSLAILGCAMAMAVSVWATKTHEVLMAVYMMTCLWLLALPIWWMSVTSSGVAAPPAWFQKLNPYVLVFAPYSSPGFAAFFDFAVFVALVLLIALGLVVLSVWRMRPVVVAQGGRSDKAPRGAWRVRRRLLPSWTGPTLDGNPVLWREWHRNRPSRLGRLLWACILGVTWIMAAWGTREAIVNGVSNRPDALGMAFVFQLMFGSLMLSAMSPTALAEERVRGSLDVLLSTPMSTTSIVLAKWWGMYRWVLLLAVLPMYALGFMAAVAPDIPSYALTWVSKVTPPLVPLNSWDRVFVATFGPADFLASGAAIVSLGLALATWVRRLGRAVAISVIIFVLGGVGWIFLLEVLVHTLALNSMEHRWIAQILVSFSPIAGPINAMSIVHGTSQYSRAVMWYGTFIVILIKAAVALLLLALTVRTFDRCMGRIAEPAAARKDRPRLLPGAGGRDRMDLLATASSPERPSFETAP